MDLASWKSKVDKIDIEKLKTVLVDLYKLSNVVDTDVVKKTGYAELVIKVNSTDTNEFVSKTQYNTDKLGIEKKNGNSGKKISDTNGLVKKKKDYNAKLLRYKAKYSV